HAGHQEPPMPTIVPLPGMQKQASPTRPRSQRNGTTDGTGRRHEPVRKKSSRTDNREHAALAECGCGRLAVREGDIMRAVVRLVSGGAVAGLLAAGMIVAAPGAPAARGASTASAPAGVQSHWAELANAVTGANLWSRSSVSQRPMGSITKVMTAYVVIRAGSLNRVITVPAGIVAYDRTYDASTAGLVPGEKLTALQLLYAMLLP